MESISNISGISFDGVIDKKVEYLKNTEIAKRLGINTFVVKASGWVLSPFFWYNYFTRSIGSPKNAEYFHAKMTNVSDSVESTAELLDHICSESMHIDDDSYIMGWKTEKNNVNLYKFRGFSYIDDIE